MTNSSPSGAASSAIYNGTAWGACNLPDALKRDSLTLYVSGYFLTSPELERMNLTPVPFEVTSARAR